MNGVSASSGGTSVFFLTKSHDSKVLRTGAAFGLLLISTLISPLVARAHGHCGGGGGGGHCGGGGGHSSFHSSYSGSHCFSHSSGFNFCHSSIGTHSNFSHSSTGTHTANLFMNNQYSSLNSVNNLNTLNTTDDPTATSVFATRMDPSSPETMTAEAIAPVGAESVEKNHHRSLFGKLFRSKNNSGVGQI